MSEEVKFYRTKKFIALAGTIIAATLSYFDILIPREVIDTVLTSLAAIGA